MLKNGFFPCSNVSQELSNLLRLSIDEEKLLADCLGLHEKAQIGDPPDKEILFNKLREINPATLIKLAKAKPIIEQSCRNPDFNTYWQKAFALLLTDSEYNWESTIQPGFSGYDLYCGFFYSKHGVTGGQSGSNLSDGKMCFLSEAVKHQSFHAQKVLCMDGISKVLTYIENNQDPSAAIELLKKLNNSVAETAKKHGTPGYLLYVKLCLCFAKYWRWQGNTDAMAISYSLVIQHMSTARALEQYCTASIYNAYADQGLIGSNPFGLDKIEAIEQQTIQLVKNNLTLAEITQAKQQGENIAAQFQYKEGVAIPQSLSL